VNIEAIGNDPDGKLTRQSHGTSNGRRPRTFRERNGRWAR
jgi:hypothetical protein